MGSTPVRLAIAEEVVGGGPEDPAADVIAAATLAAGFLVSLIAENVGGLAARRPEIAGEVQAVAKLYLISMTRMNVTSY